MTYYMIVLLHLFIGVAICDPLNTEYSTETRNNIAHRNGTSNIPSEETTIKDTVEVKVYYETLCPFSVNFFVYQLKPAMERLGSHLDIHLIPYGHAETIDKGNGVYEFKCQHGPEECYGNKLHACAIDHLGNVTKAVFFNSCMMESSRTNRGSDDKAADECGKTMNVDPEWIKQCAKGDRGNALLKYYGDENKNVGYRYVPYVLINGVQNDGDNFMRDVCAAFKTPPPECAQVV